MIALTPHEGTKARRLDLRSTLDLEARVRRGAGRIMSGDDRPMRGVDGPAPAAYPYHMKIKAE
jgi:hypothetical protein